MNNAPTARVINLNSRVVRISLADGRTYDLSWADLEKLSASPKTAATYAPLLTAARRLAAQRGVRFPARPPPLPVAHEVDIPIHVDLPADMRDTIPVPPRPKVK
jgi:hypothetical protein